MAIAYLSLGSNLGDREGCIRKALALLKEKCKMLKTSSLYETEPVGYKDQPLFLNCAVKAETSMGPQELLAFLQSVEKRLGRGTSNGPRVIDLDLLFYNNMVLNEENLAIPHPRAHERRFVLEPLKEIEPGFVHPVLAKTVEELLVTIGSGQKVAFYKRLRQ